MTSPPELNAAEIAALIDASGDQVVVLDRDGRCLKVVTSGRRYRPAELLGRTLDEILPAADAERFVEAIGRALATRAAQPVEYSLDIGSNTVWFSGTVAPTSEDTVVWIAPNLSGQPGGLEALRARDDPHDDLLASLPVIIYWVAPDPPFTPIYVSPGAHGLGYTQAEWMGPLWIRILHPDDRDRIFAETAAAVAARTPVEYEYRLFAKDGGVRWIHDRGAFVQDEQGRTIAWRGVMIDITERRALEERLAALSEADELTGLLNRRGFRRMAEQALKVEGRSGRRTALLYFDLDDLKPINDQYGHAAGDRALRAVADVLRSGVREGDLVGRVGGDEFVVLAPGVGAAGEGARLAGRLRAQLAEYNARAGQPYRVDFSVGVVEEPGVADLDRLLERADAALYAEKAARRTL